MNDLGDTVAAIAAMAVVTFALRGLPFVAARWLQRHPGVQRVGRFLPMAIMVMLVLHAGVGAARQHVQGPWSELLAVAVVVGLQWRWRHPLLSILAGTGLYVLLRNLPFALQ
jgi:branched-subunit amino acid transport protein AzlD